MTPAPALGIMWRRWRENRWLSLDPKVRLFGPDELLVLFGCRVTSFGKVNGASPE